MSDENEHYRYLETIDRLSRSGWGKKYDSPEDADKDMMNNEDLPGFCLLEIVRKINVFIDYLTRDEMKRIVKEALDHVYSDFEERINDREIIHGPCPQSVKRAIKHNLNASIGDRMCWSKSFVNIGCSDLSYYLPEKGTDARREYNKWMKRKVKKSEKGEVK